MTIRRRLATFIVLMLALLVGLGGLLLIGGPSILVAFSQSLESMETLNTVREIRTYVTHQRTALNRYLLLDDPQELINFDEASRSAQETLNNIKTQSANHPPSWFKEFLPVFEETQKSAQQVTSHYKKGNKLRAYEEAMNIFGKLLNYVNTLEKQKAQEADLMFHRIQNIIRFVGSIVTVALILAFILSVFLFRSLYKAVMGPLEILRKGADEFGKGQWDNRIELSSRNEFGALAASFNTMAENVKQLQMQTVHLDRMSAVGQLAGGVAHEINNPLTAVLGQAQILMAKLTESDPMYAQLGKIENAALRCKKIVRGLLDFSRPSQTSFEDIKANEVLQATLDLCEADLKKSKVTVEKKFSMTLPTFKGNASELQQVLLNLINNAIQAMPKGGVLNLDTHVNNDPLIFVDRRKGGSSRKIPGPWIEIAVKDTGVGIPKEHLSRVFEPFFTTKEIGKGTGLGLAVSMGIIQKHGGDLRVESLGANKGACFIIHLPVKRMQSHDIQSSTPGIAA